MERVKVIVGLGNPGDEYERTRHNAGFLCLDQIAASQSRPWARERKFQAETTVVEFGGNPVLLVKPLTFVNRSGETVSALGRYYRFPANRFCVVYDDITMDLGRVKLSVGGGAGGHNGVTDLMKRMGNEFLRMRMGVGGKPDSRMDLKDWVLSRFSKDEESRLEEAFSVVRSGLDLLVTQGLERAMNRINTKSKAS